jgi:hypothetical protein
VSDLTLDRLILKEAAKGNFAPRAGGRASSRSGVSCRCRERRACAGLGQHRSAPALPFHPLHPWPPCATLLRGSSLTWCPLGLCRVVAA